MNVVPEPTEAVRSPSHCLRFERRDDADGLIERLVVLAEREADDSRRELVLRVTEERRRWDHGQLRLLAQLVRDLVVRVALFQSTERVSH